MNLRDIHTPVLLDRCAELLAPALQREGAVFVDATLGMGGHSEAFLERFPGIRLVGLDRDTDALRIAGSAWRASETASPSCTRCTTASPTP
nr:hypothetical protein GCM10025699_24200 [Microbacterium flavescens]